MLSTIWRALEHSALYSTWQSFVGADRMRQTLVTQHLHPKPNDVVVDIGCGPAEIIDYLPPVRYFGFDINPAYIEAARKRYSDRGVFRVLDVERAVDADLLGHADLVMAIGVLHHLDDTTAENCIALAHSHLKPGGRFVTIDGVIHRGQGLVRWCIVSADRGRHVRSPDAYRAIARTRFSLVNDFTYGDLTTIPTSHFVMECTKDMSAVAI